MADRYTHSEENIVRFCNTFGTVGKIVLDVFNAYDFLGLEQERGEPQGAGGVFTRQERTLERRCFDRSWDDVFLRAHDLEGLPSLPRVPELAGISRADHVLGMGKQRLREGRAGLPVVPHVERQGRRGGSPSETIGDDRHQSPPNARRPLHSAVE